MICTAVKVRLKILPTRDRSTRRSDRLHERISSSTWWVLRQERFLPPELLLNSRQESQLPKHSKLPRMAQSPCCNVPVGARGGGSEPSIWPWFRKVFGRCPGKPPEHVPREGERVVAAPFAGGRHAGKHRRRAGPLFLQRYGLERRAEEMLRENESRVT